MKLVCFDNNFEYGLVGTHTPLKDDYGEPLRVGDVVLLESKSTAWSKFRFVAYDSRTGNYYITGAYFGTENYGVKLMVPHENLTEGFGIGNMYYAERLI